MVADQLEDIKVEGREVLVVADLMLLVEQALQDKEITGETEITPALVIIMLVGAEVLVPLVQMVLVIMLQPPLEVMVAQVLFPQ
jgi:hypothetical protein